MTWVNMLLPRCRPQHRATKSAFPRWRRGVDSWTDASDRCHGTRTHRSRSDGLGDQPTTSDARSCNHGAGRWVLSRRDGRRGGAVSVRGSMMHAVRKQSESPLTGVTAAQAHRQMPRRQVRWTAPRSTKRPMTPTETSILNGCLGLRVPTIVLLGVTGAGH